MRKNPATGGYRLSVIRHLACAITVYLLASVATAAPALPADFILEPYVSGLSGPVKMVWNPAGDTLYIAEKRGVVRVARNGSLLPANFIDLSAEVSTASDRGLLGIALHPNFPATNWVYLLYTYDPPETATRTDAAGRDGVGQRVSRLIRVSADPATNYQTAVPGSAVVILGSASTWANIGDPVAQQTDLGAPWSCGPSGAYINDCLPSDGLSHSIGTVAFGNDGMLYVGNGDAATWTTVDPKALRVLDVDSLAGKILRINPATGAGLSDNPFYDGNASSNRSRVWQLGLRNPFRFQIAQDNKVWLGDVGWNSWEELNQGPAGADFGWPCYEGDNNGSRQEPGYAATARCQNYYPTASPVAPRHAYPHVSGVGGAIVAGPIYTATKWPTEYRGRLFFSDFSAAVVRVARIDTSPVTVTPFATEVLAVDIVLGPDGDLYLADIATGRINRIVYVGDSTPPPTVSFPVTRGADDGEQVPNGKISLSSTQISLGGSAGKRIAGFRFQNVQLSDPAEIVQAYIQFTSATSGTSTAVMNVRAEAADSAPPLPTGNNSFSSKVLTSQSATWNVQPWTTALEAGPAQRTPDLKAVLSEILRRPGWRAGNAMAFFVTGDGGRSASAYEGGAANAARLIIVLPKTTNTDPTVSIGAPLSGTIVSQSYPVTFSATAADAEDNDATLTAAIVWTSSRDGQIGTGGSFTTSTLSVGTHVITAAVTDSGGATASNSITLQVTTNRPPTASILTPATGTLWRANQGVSFSGSGSDPEDGTLGAAALSWTALIHHNTHVHGDYFNGSGLSGNFVYPDHDDDSYLELCLTATDSAGLKDTKCLNLLPQLVTYTFQSVPTGLNLSYNSQLRAAPFSVQAMVGGGRQIGAPTPQGTWHFRNWSNGGLATQQITIAATNQTLTATFNSEPGVSITAPAPNASFALGAPVQFTALATDAEDGDGLASSIRWSSSLDGTLGTGASISVSTLRAGNHVITAAVTDSAGLTGSDSIPITVSSGGGSWVRQAGYQSDFRGITPAAGWAYLWNANGAIGTAANYASLLWNGGDYDSDGLPGQPDATQSRYGKLASTGGHPGQGSSQGATVDRYMIAAYTAPGAGAYRIAGSSITHAGCQWSNGLRVNVYRNDTSVVSVTVPQGGAASFNTDLGTLAAGDKIYVAAGPNTTDGCDAFLWDYAIERQSP